MESAASSRQADEAVGHSAGSIYTGMFANEVLPLRPGELIRAYVLAAASRIPFSVAVSSPWVSRWGP